MTEVLPCSTCKAECCGPVPLSRQLIKRIAAEVSRMSPDERQRLAGQERGPLDCRFVDTANHRCMIYELRPEVCRIYGLTADLQCPHASQLVTTISPVGASIRIKRDITAGVEMFSNQWDWNA